MPFQVTLEHLQEQKWERPDRNQRNYRLSLKTDAKTVVLSATRPAVVPSGSASARVVVEKRKQPVLSVLVEPDFEYGGNVNGQRCVGPNETTIITDDSDTMRLIFRPIAASPRKKL